MMRVKSTARLFTPVTVACCIPGLFYDNKDFFFSIQSTDTQIILENNLQLFMTFTSKMSKAVKHNLRSGPPCNAEVEMKELTIRALLIQIMWVFRVICGRK